MMPVLFQFLLLSQLRPIVSLLLTEMASLCFSCFTAAHCDFPVSFQVSHSHSLGCLCLISGILLPFILAALHHPPVPLPLPGMTLCHLSCLTITK